MTPELLAITPPASQAPVVDAELVAAWLRAGLGERRLAVLLREPGADAATILSDDRLLALRRALDDADIPALLSVDPAQALADPELPALVVRARPAIRGLQLRGDPELAVIQRVRARFPALILGRSSHGEPPTAGVVASSQRLGLDYSCVAPIFAPRTRQPGVDKQAIGLDSLARWCARDPRVVALGGLDGERARACLDAGAAGVAGISMFFGAIAQVEDNAASLRRVLARAAQARADDVSKPPQR